jgi:hypothetical protein
MNVLSEWAFIGLFFVLAPLLPALPIVLGVALAPQAQCHQDGNL